MIESEHSINPVLGNRAAQETLFLAMEPNTSLTPASRVLGYAGLLPQIICMAIVLTGSQYQYSALFMGFVYPAMIFSFLGGVWWGQAIERDGQASAGAYGVAVLPSLIAAALFIPYLEGWEWPGPAMLYLGAFLALSPMVDRALGYSAPDFMRLRWHLSLGLGVLTIAFGFVTMQVMAPRILQQRPTRTPVRTSISVRVPSHSNQSRPAFPRIGAVKAAASH